MTQRIPQWQRLLEKFHFHGNVLLTSDFRDDPHLYNEWRRAMCELKNKGHVVVKTQVQKNLFRYALVHFDDHGQGSLAI